jgi:predicted transglutaminase-like cysteine proteinase
MPRPDYRPPARTSRWLAALVLLSLAACAGFDVRPSLSHNYQLQPLQPAESSAEAMWLVKLQVALANCDGDRQLLSEAGDRCVAEWRDSLKPLAGRPALEQAREVNRIVNQSVRYVSDESRPGGADHWSSPLETLRNGGDCEDLALLKRESLRLLGWPEDRLALLVGHSAEAVPPAFHAALLVTLENGAQMVLDSAEPDVLVPRHGYHFIAAYALTRTHIYKVIPWQQRRWRD